MKYEVGDVTDMKGKADGSFDVVLDKSTMDALLCGDNSFLMTAKMLHEVQRVLKPGGYYFMVSYGEPESRIFHLEREFLSFDISYYKKTNYVKEPACDSSEGSSGSEEKVKVNHIYVCQKLPDANEVADKYYKFCIEQLKEDEEKL